MMRTKILRLLIVAFGLSALGSLAITPRVSFGQERPESEADTRARWEAQKEYQDGYNRGYEESRAAEQRRIDDQVMQSQNGGMACCGGGQQQPPR